MDRKQFGKLVAALRKEQYDENGDRYTQASLAEAILAQDRQTPLNEIIIGKIERGERAILDEHTLLNLAGVQGSASALLMVAADGYQSEIDLAIVQACSDCLIAIREDGSLSMVMVGLESNYWVNEVVALQVK